jgi:hypothetical protein
MHFQNIVDPTPAEASAMAKKKKHEKWGPVVPIRQSGRLIHDGMTVMDKAKALQEIKNLEKPKQGKPKNF